MFELYNSQQKRIISLSCATLVFLCSFLYQSFSELFINWNFIGFAAKPNVTFQIICCILIGAGVVQLAARSFIDHREIKYRSFHDENTGLANDKKLFDTLNSELQSANRESGMALLIIDIDSLKHVNESIGYAGGDEIIKQLSSRLRDYVYGNLQLFKMSGGQFCLLVPAVESSDQIDSITDDIFKNAMPAFLIEDREFYVDVSIGSEVFRNSEFKPSTIVRSAEFALRQAKKNGGNRHVSYDEGDAITLRNQSTLDADLRKMIESKEVELAFQPLVDSKTGKMRGVEVLSRWNHAEHGYISPTRFIASAEKLGLISKLGSQVMTDACLQFKDFDALKVSVNISSNHFLEDGFVEGVQEILEITDFPASRLELEITETVLLVNSELAVERIRQIRSLGISIALDDFGVGYSGLSYMNKFKVNRIKVDASFIRELETSASSRSIVSTIIRLGYEQGFEVTVEGVETKGQLEFLERFDDLCYQGFLFSKPLSLDEFMQCEYFKTIESTGVLLQKTAAKQRLFAKLYDGEISQVA